MSKIEVSANTTNKEIVAIKQTHTMKQTKDESFLSASSVNTKSLEQSSNLDFAI